MSCIYKIKQSSSSFTATEKRIAEYILNNREQALEFTAQKLAEETDTSAAALIRFAQKLGYMGITAMKLDLAKDEDESDELFNVLIEENDSIELMVKKVQKISERNIQQTYKLLNITNLNNAIDKVKQAKNIYLIGIGGSGIVCMDFMQKLTRINRNVIYHEDFDVLLARLAHIDKEDILIAISYSGETQMVNLAVDYAKENDVSVIAITQYNVKSTLSKNADIKLYTPIEEKELRLGAISSRNSALVLTDLIYYGIAKENFNETKSDLTKTRSLIHKLKKN
ncbi:MurR/RpiR family transcriptional regulator [Erysipelotrichaceae bacterium HCN-30851]